MAGEIDRAAGAEAPDGGRGHCARLVHRREGAPAFCIDLDMSDAGARRDRLAGESARMEGHRPGGGRSSLWPRTGAKPGW